MNYRIELVKPNGEYVLGYNSAETTEKALKREARTLLASEPTGTIARLMRWSPSDTALEGPLVEWVLPGWHS